MNRTWLAIAFLAIAFFVGCAGGRSLVVLLPDADGEIGSIEVASAKDSVFLNKGFSAVSVAPNQTPDAPRDLKPGDIEEKFEKAIAIEPPQQYRFKKSILYCHNNSTELTADSKKQLTAIVSQMASSPPNEIYVAGHTDRTGTERYNLQLSKNRANAVQRALIDGGINPSTIKVFSMGMTAPLISTPVDIPEAKNRRVELILKYRRP